MIHSTIKSGLQKGLGALGGLFGIKGDTGKPDGSQAKPYHVIVDGGGGKSPTDAVSALGGLKGIGGLLQKGLSGIGGFFKGLLGGGAGGGIPSVTSDIAFLAGGGDVDPGGSYVVGDGGEPELFRPRTAGSVTPFSKMGGGVTNHYVIDARGAEVGVEHRIGRAIETAHNSAVATSVRATAERARRTPQRS